MPKKTKSASSASTRRKNQNLLHGTGCSEVTENLLGPSPVSAQLRLKGDIADFMEAARAEFLSRPVESCLKADFSIADGGDEAGEGLRTTIGFIGVRRHADDRATAARNSRTNLDMNEDLGIGIIAVANGSRGAAGRPKKRKQTKTGNSHHSMDPEAVQYGNNSTAGRLEKVTFASAPIRRRRAHRK